MVATVGSAKYVNWTLSTDSPPAVVTLTAAGPSAFGGVTAVSELPSAATTTSRAGTPANSTSVEPTTKLVPTIVTGVPPAVGPESGVTLETVGSRRYV